MRWADFLQLALRSLTAHRMRSALTLGGIAVGIAAVILLTSIGEGLHRFVLQEFGQFGTNVIEITPPLTITHDEVTTATHLLTEAIDRAALGHVTDDDIAPYSGW